MDPAAASLVSYGYRDVQLLGSGSFGHVYRVLTRAGEVAAAKVASEPVAKRITLEETDVMKYIPPHPNVLQLHDVHIMGDSVVVLLAYASGGDTLKMMQERNLKPLCEGTARKLFRQLLCGLMHLHNAGVVHRDIKCENLLLTGPERRTLLIADFGYATHWRRGDLLTDNVGSLHYCAPEVCAGRPYEGPEVDVWSAGVVLYAWATGRLPFGGNSQAELATRIQQANFALPQHLSPQLCCLLLRMLEADRFRRITVGEILSHEWVQANHTEALLPASPSPPPTALATSHGPGNGSAFSCVSPHRARLTPTLPPPSPSPASPSSSRPNTPPPASQPPPSPQQTPSPAPQCPQPSPVPPLVPRSTGKRQRDSVATVATRRTRSNKSLQAELQA